MDVPVPALLLGVLLRGGQLVVFQCAPLGRGLRCDESLLVKGLTFEFELFKQAGLDSVFKQSQVFKFNNGRKIAYKLIRYMLEREKYRERWVGSLQKTKVPLRLINGLADPVSGAHLVKRFREIMPPSDIIELVDIGHFPHFEVPDKTLRYFFEFHEKT